MTQVRCLNLLKHLSQIYFLFGALHQMGGQTLKITIVLHSMITTVVIFMITIVCTNMNSEIIKSTWLTIIEMVNLT